MRYTRFYPQLLKNIKADVFDVIDYFSNNRSSFDGLHFATAFGKLFDECKAVLDIDNDSLARAVDICLTLEQRRMNSYSQGNTHIEDYHPAEVKH